MSCRVISVTRVAKTVITVFRFVCGIVRSRDRSDLYGQTIKPNKSVDSGVPSLKLEEDAANHFALVLARDSSWIEQGNGMGDGRGVAVSPRALTASQIGSIAGSTGRSFAGRCAAGFACLSLRLKTTGPFSPMPVARISRHFCCSFQSYTGAFHRRDRDRFWKYPGFHELVPATS